MTARSPIIGFAKVCSGVSIEIINNGQQAKRKALADAKVSGICFVNESYQIDEMVLIKIVRKISQENMVAVWDKNNYLGFTNKNPDSFQKFSLPLHKDVPCYAEKREGDFVIFQISGETLKVDSVIKFWIEKWNFKYEMPCAEKSCISGIPGKKWGSIKSDMQF